MLEERHAISVSVQKHSQIFIDICLCKIVRKLLKIQYRLRDLQAIGVDSTVRVLSQAEFLCKKRNSLCESRHGLNGLVQVCIGHGVLWCRGLMTGLLRGSRHLPAPLIRTKISVK